MKKNTAKELSVKDAEMCLFLGGIGVVFSSICLIQHLQVILDDTINYAFAFAYILAIVTYVLLMMKKYFSAIMLTVVSALLFINITFYLLLQCFSFLAFSLMLFTIVVTIFLFISEIPTKLKQHKLYTKQENVFWDDKL